MCPSSLMDGVNKGHTYASRGLDSKHRGEKMLPYLVGLSALRIGGLEQVGGVDRVGGDGVLTLTQLE
jgi:hypothetical protein